MADRLQVLVVGWLNSPHVVSWAEAVATAGYDVQLAGREAPDWAPAVLGENVHPLPASGPLLVRSLRMSSELAAVAARLEPDLVHAHWLSEFGWMAARGRLRPLVCSAWGSDVLGVRGLGRQRSRRALAGADLALADSAELARATAELAGRDLRVEVVRWGLDLEHFSPGDAVGARERLGLPTAGPLVASVRGVDAVYNPELVLAAFARARQDRPDARLLFKHPLTTAPRALENTATRLGLAEAVTMLGSVPPELMPDVYRAADVVVSVPSSDSSPRTVWEALACGRPVVVSDLPWARDELEPDRHAVFVPLEADSVAAAIRRVLDDEALARDLGAEARAVAAETLDPAACTARIDALYRSVVSGGS